MPSFAAMFTRPASESVFTFRITLPRSAFTGDLTDSQRRVAQLIQNTALGAVRDPSYGAPPFPLQRASAGNGK